MTPSPSAGAGRALRRLFVYVCVAIHLIAGNCPEEFSVPRSLQTPSVTPYPSHRELILHSLPESNPGVTGFIKCSHCLPHDIPIIREDLPLLPAWTHACSHLIGLPGVPPDPSPGVEAAGPYLARLCPEGLQMMAYRTQARRHLEERAGLLGSLSLMPLITPL